MKHEVEYFFCSEKLLENIPEIQEINACVENIKWAPDFVEHDIDGNYSEHQTAYNKSFEFEFAKLGWTNKPLLHNKPRLIGDFGKNDVFVEIQFGNSSTLYRDYYKFHYGLMHKKLTLAVLIVPTSPKLFFPNRHKSVSNMAEFSLACRYFELLPIPVPIMVIGLLPEN